MNSSFNKTTPNKRNKWAIDLNIRKSNDRSLIQLTELSVPSGYTEQRINVDINARENNPDLIAKKSWDIALGPIKQIPMNFFLMWMAGNSISIFPIMMVGMMFIRPIQAMVGVQQTFKMIEGQNELLQKATYILGNLLCLAIAVYKCNSMGLLPTHPSDWLAFVEPPTRIEYSSGGGVML